MQDCQILRRTWIVWSYFTRKKESIDGAVSIVVAIPVCWAAKQETADSSFTRKS